MGKRDISRDMGGFPNERLMAVSRGGAKSPSVSQQKISGHKSTTRRLLYRKVRARQRDLLHRGSSSFLVGKHHVYFSSRTTDGIFRIRTRIFRVPRSTPRLCVICKMVVSRFTCYSNSNVHISSGKKILKILYTLQRGFFHKKKIAEFLHFPF